MLLHTKYQRADLDVDYYPNFLNVTLATAWYQYLESFFPKANTRTSMIFGNPGLIYRVTYRGITKETEVLPWDALPGLEELKTLVETIIGQKITVCVIQMYPNGKVGIAPHRDKEMVAGTKICGLSIGEHRFIEFSRGKHDSVKIGLHSGGLYVMNHPTNEKWLHSIIEELNKTGKRYSLTFRDY